MKVPLQWAHRDHFGSISTFRIGFDDTPDGSFETISHELTHVLQYRKKAATFACSMVSVAVFIKRDSAHLCQIEDAAYV